MRLFSAFLFFVFAVMAGPWSATAASRFAHQGVAEDAARYEKYVRETWKPGGKTAADLRLAAGKQMESDARAASRNYATAVSADPKSSESWLGLDAGGRMDYEPVQ